ncbi:MAG: MarR family transcriptional regulator [Acidobacteriaceae bacterium]|nr:MarR family transcriptional regulator [Acidobacteriaceae bacterium]
MDGIVDDKEVTRFLTAWFAVRQVIQAANFNHFHKAGLSATQFMTLNLLPENGDSITIGELARRMNLKPATVAKTVDSLEKREMLSRTKSTADGRLVLVKITKQGSKLQNAAVGQFREQISDIFRTIPANDRAALVNGLESFVRAASDGNADLQASAGLTRDAHAAPPVKHSSRQSPQR